MSALFNSYHASHLNYCKLSYKQLWILVMKLNYLKKDTMAQYKVH
jgi:hypothetical protein